MNEFLLLAVIPVASRHLLAEGASIPNLLTGGGFVFLAAVMGGLFLMNKNASDGAAAIAKGARDYVEGAREELQAARNDAKSARDEAAEARDETASARRATELATREAREAREDLHAAHRALDDAQAAIRAGQNERARLRRWIENQCEANRAHQEWDVELQALLARSGMEIRPAPPLAVDPPPTKE